MTRTDVILIGAGPIGLEMAVALRDAGISYRHIEGQQVGSTIGWFPRQARFFSSPERIAICGVPLVNEDQSKATRETYLAYLHGIVQQFQLPIQTYERVTQITARPAVGDAATATARFQVDTVRTDGPHTYEADRIILAIGDMHRPRRLRDPQGHALDYDELPHVTHYFEEPHPYVGQRLLIVGGRNSAAEAAIRCHRAGARVGMSYRRDQLEGSIKYWLKPELEWLIRTGDIAFYPQTVPVRIDATHVTLAPVADAKTLMPSATDWRSIPADFVLLMVGYEMDSSLLRTAGVQLHGAQQAPVVNGDTMETNVPGLYIAGTAAAGTQLNFRLFIENCHMHVVRIMRHLAGCEPRHISPLAYRCLHEQVPLAES